MDSLICWWCGVESTLDRKAPELYESQVMKTLAFLLKLVLALVVVIPAWAAEPAGKATVVLISGEFEYESAKTLPAFKKFLEASHPFNCIFLEREKGESIPGLEALEKADLVILFVRRMTLPDKQLARFKKYLES